MTLVSPKSTLAGARFAEGAIRKPVLCVKDLTASTSASIVPGGV